MKRWNNLKKSILISFILMFVFAQILPAQQVKAAEQKGSIRLKCEDNAGITFKLYLVAKQDKHDGYDLVEPFDEYSVDLTKTSAAQTLADYVERDDVEPLRMDETDGDGVIVFDALEEGAYLILIEPFEFKNEKNESMIMKANPVFLTVPENKEGVLTWDRSVDAKGVHTVKPESKDDKQNISVQKIWKDDEDKEHKRPKSIVAQLKVGNKIIDEQVLNEDNNWQYTWTDLEPASYSVMEKNVPVDYQVEKENAGVNKFVLVNNYNPVKPTPPGPTPPTKKTTGSGGGSSKLPQTGQLWWPIGIMLCAGLLCLIVGIRVGRSKED